MPETGVIEQTTRRRPAYTRCPTCGRYLTPEERAIGRFCSETCAQTYHRCTNCGRYYPQVDAYSPEHCSEACATRYSLRRSYGPAQIDIGVEELV